MFGREVGTVSTIKTAAGVDPIAVSLQQVVYSDAIPIFAGKTFGVEFLPASSGQINVQVDIEESMDGTNFCVADGAGTLATLVNTNRRIMQVAPVPAKFIRFKYTGLSTNHTTTTVQTKLFHIEAL